LLLKPIHPKICQKFNITNSNVLWWNKTNLANYWGNIALPLLLVQLAGCKELPELWLATKIVKPLHQHSWNQ
jgi:hypothetical protein